MTDRERKRMKTENVNARCVIRCCRSLLRHWCSQYRLSK